MTEDTTASGLSHLTHVYFEIGGELLSKPNALAQIIEGNALNAALVFCNTPSDTDLVEVLLKKRGVAARKLIGNIPPPKLEKTMSQLKEGEITTVVVTDIAARGIDIDNFDVLIHYTAPSDGDTYAHRISKSGPFNRLKKVMTLVGPLDITNFHYVKKAIPGDIALEELPSMANVQSAKVERLASLATQKGLVTDERYTAMIEDLLKNKNRNGIIALLLNNTFETIPALQLAAEREDEPIEEDEDDNRGNRERGAGRFQGGGRGGDRRDDNRRDDSRGGERRGGDRRAAGGDDRRGGGRRPYADLDENPAGDSDDRGSRRDQRPMLPPLRESRIYIGEGQGSGMTVASLKSMVQAQAGISEEDIRRVVLRKNYAFFDVLDEKSDDVIGKLEQAKGASGESLIVRKATTISSQRSAPMNEAGASSEEQGPTSESMDAPIEMA